MKRECNGVRGAAVKYCRAAQDVVRASCRRPSGLLGRIVAAGVLSACLSLCMAPLARADAGSAAAQAVATLPAAAPGAPIQVRFAGVSTLLFSDGETAWMIDGFFSRPSGLKTLFGRIAPDTAAIQRNLARLGSPKLAAVIPIHSHYDHAMDSPIVAQRTGAILIGSESTLNIGRGLGMQEASLRKVVPDEVVRLGKWTLTFLASHHGPTMDLLRAEGTIDAPLVPPKHALRWKDGQVWTILVEHDSGATMLVHGSASVPGKRIMGRRADVVFLGAGMLGKQPEAYRARLWNEVVLGFKAKRVIPIHWDDLTQSLDQPLEPMPGLLDNFERTLGDFKRWSKRDGVDLAMPPVFTPFDPAVSLPQ